MIDEGILRINIQKYLEEAYEREIPHSPDAFRVAEKNGFKLVPSPDQQECSDRPIYYNQEDNPENQQWSIARGIVKHIAFDLISEKSIPRSICERIALSIADRNSIRILIPDKYFADDYLSDNGDLFALKEKYHNAGYDAIALACIDMLREKNENGILTIVEKPAVTDKTAIQSRLSTSFCQIRDVPFTRLEEDILAKTLETGEYGEDADEVILKGFHYVAKVRAWPTNYDKGQRIYIILKIL